MKKYNRNRRSRIIISVSNNLETDQRVHKLATTITEKNTEVLVIGRQFMKSDKPYQREYSTIRLKYLINNGPLFYAEMNIRLFLFLLFSRFDTLLSVDLDTLPANHLVSKIRRKSLIYDCHEIFPEVPELVHRPGVKAIWETIESLILPKIKNAITVSSGVAKYYKEKYGIEMSVIRNLPFRKTFSIPQRNTNEKIIIYQGATNIGRGLENIIQAMQYMSNTKLWIIGNGDIYSELFDLVRKNHLEDKVVFYGRIPFEKLHEITLKADLGISLEEDLGLNYRYSLPNKVFDYIQARIPILVSNLPEMSKIVKKYHCGEIVNSTNPKALSEQINNILKQDLKSVIQEKLDSASKELCWENEKEILFNILKL